MQKPSDPAADGGSGPAPSPRPVLSDKPDGRAVPVPAANQPREIGGPAGPEPTRFGDWEKKGRCIDF